MRESDAVWGETTDGGLLRQLFGHYPTLHEATIREIVVNAAARSAMAIVDYEDQDETGRSILTARIRLEWDGVRSMNLFLGETELFGLTFVRRDMLIESHLETSPGVFGTVISEQFEAVLMQMDAPREEDIPRLKIAWS